MTEAQIHRSIIAYLRSVMPDAVINHSAGEGVRGGKAGIMDGARRKAMGQTAGYPDIEVLPPAQVGPLFFEVKKEGSYTSPTQKELHIRLHNLGYRCAVVRSIDDVRDFLRAWEISTREAAK